MMRQFCEPLVMIILLLATTLLSSAWACGSPLTYSAEAIEAWIVDEDTGQPLEGVIVVAHWQLEGGFHRDAVGELMVIETVSDAKGHFSFPAWGPKLRPLKGYLHHKDPEFFLFKRDYEYLAASNRWSAPENTNSLRRSDWNGTTLTMKKFTGSLEGYASLLGFLNTSFETVIAYGGNCEWKKVPRMLLALDHQKKLFEEKKVYSNLFSIEALPDQDRCGSAREYVRSYRP